jgi:hypothetical protein
MKQNHSQAASLSPQSPTWSSVWQRLRRRSCLAALTAASGLLGIATNGLAQRDLQQIPDPDPSVSLASFTLPDGLQANLFGGDGQISKPIHMNFDARGRLWVAGSEVYPQIEQGRVIVDVAVDGLSDAFIGQRVLVRVPVAARQVLAVPDVAIEQRAGLDLVTIKTADGSVQVTVIPGAEVAGPDVPLREILTGLRAGDTVITP